MPLCFDCHAEVNSYNPRHPKGNKYSPSELRKLRDETFKKVSGDATDDLTAQVSAIERRLAEVASSIPKSGTASRFAIATSEFHQRTCEIGFVNGSCYNHTGLCCFIEKDKAITSREALALLEDVLTVRDGTAVIISKVGMATFEIVAHLDEGISIIRSGPFDTSAWNRHNRACRTLADELPLQTPVKLRRHVYPGEEVAFLNIPSNTSRERWTMTPQVERVSLSFRRKSRPPTVSYFLGTPIGSYISYGGGPAFTEDGHLVGVVTDTVQYEGESLIRPVIATLVMAAELFSGSISPTMISAPVNKS